MTEESTQDSLRLILIEQLKSRYGVVALDIIHVTCHSKPLRVLPKIPASSSSFICQFLVKATMVPPKVKGSSHIDQEIGNMRNDT